jgi:hypothetical protein
MLKRCTFHMTECLTIMDKLSHLVLFGISKNKHMYHLCRVLCVALTLPMMGVMHYEQPATH